jgi:hypothetical protein
VCSHMMGALDEQSVVKVPRRTETGAGAAKQGEKRENTGSI